MHTCTNLNCPERKSLCCAKTCRVSNDGERMLGVDDFFCGGCGKKYIGGGCNANTEETIQLPIAWIKRLKEYTADVAKKQDARESEITVNRLLGYLESLDALLTSEKVKIKS